MSIDEFVSQIEYLGLSNKEARVYIAALGLGASPVQAIADRAGIKRVTTYAVLDSLVSKGLIAQTEYSNKTYFSAEDPINLGQMIQSRAIKQKDQELKFKDLLPRLIEARNSPKMIPLTKFSFGAEQAKQLIGDLTSQLDENQAEVHIFANAENDKSVIGEWVNSNERRALNKRGIRTKLLSNSVNNLVQRADVSKGMHCKRFTPNLSEIVKGEIIITEKCVVTISMNNENLISFLTDNYVIVSPLRALFKLVWDESAKTNE